MKPACAESTLVTLAWCHRETVGPRSGLPGLAADLRDCFPGSNSEFSRYGRSHLCQNTAVPHPLRECSTPCRGSLGARAVSYQSVRVPLAVGLVTLPGEAHSAVAPWASDSADLRTEVGLPGALGPRGQKHTAPYWLSGVFQKLIQ